MREDPIVFLDSAIQAWSANFEDNSAELIPTNKSVQQFWDLPICDKRFDILVNSLTSEVETARIKAVSSKHASHWLKAYPVQNLALKLSNSSFRIACALRLGAPVCLPHPCICGKVMVDQFGRHGLSCEKAALSRNARHNNANSLIQKALTSAEFAAISEPKGLFSTDKKRPDGMTTYPYKEGKPLAWDYTCVDTTCASYSHQSAKEGGKAAEMAEEKKKNKYSHLTDYFFIPIGAETLGPFGPEAIRFIEDLGNKISIMNGDKRSKSYLFQSLSIAVQRGNGACVMGTSSSSEVLDDLAYL